MEPLRWVRLFRAAGKKQRGFEGAFGFLAREQPSQKHGWLYVWPQVTAEFQPIPKDQRPAAAIAWRSGSTYMRPVLRDSGIFKYLQQEGLLQVPEEAKTPEPVAAAAAAAFSVTTRVKKTFRLAWNAMRCFCASKTRTFHLDDGQDIVITTRARFLCTQTVVFDVLAAPPGEEAPSTGRAKAPIDTASESVQEHEELPVAVPETAARPSPGKRPTVKALLDMRLAKHSLAGGVDLRRLPVLYLPDILAQLPSHASQVPAAPKGNATTAAIRSFLKQAWPETMVTAGYHGAQEGSILVEYDIDHAIPESIGGLSHVNNYVIMPSCMNRSFGKDYSREKEAYIGKDISQRVTAFQRHVAAAAVASPLFRDD
jgi:hypothetical protein